MVLIYSPIAQLVERLTVNQNVRGSSPRRGAKQPKNSLPYTPPVEAKSLKHKVGG